MDIFVKILLCSREHFSLYPVILIYNMIQIKRLGRYNIYYMHKTTLDFMLRYLVKMSFIKLSLLPVRKLFVAYITRIKKSVGRGVHSLHVSPVRCLIVIFIADLTLPFFNSLKYINIKISKSTAKMS